MNNIFAVQAHKEKLKVVEWISFCKINISYLVNNLHLISIVKYESQLSRYEMNLKISVKFFSR